ncbi:MAG: C4-dicarboxylate ABC transporter [Acidobacteria bacterium]|nr:C4-dicarboxylate ABC transporter [Acidobacteriota bacterium]
MLSLAALLVVILLSCVTRLNVGFLAIALAWLLSLATGISSSIVLSGFPSSLFLTLVGVTLLFTQAEVNGTLEQLAHWITRLARGNAASIVILFFLLSAFLSTLGAGALPTAALAAPLAMGAASRAGISPFLMAVMVGNGANAGNLSPLSPIGVIVDEQLIHLNLADAGWQLYRNHLLAHVLISVVVLLALGGLRVFRQPVTMPKEERSETRWTHWLTLAVIALLMTGVIFFKLPVGLAAFAAATVLTVARAAPEEAVVAKMSWGVMVMVCGMSMLIAIVERTGGLDLFTAAIARFSTPQTVTAVVAFVSGIVSAYSSTSGVVLPAFLPMAGKLVTQLGGGDVTSILSSICLGSHLVDVSPLSTIGAICIASAGTEVDRRVLFRQLMIWGLSMSFVGAIASFLFFGVLFQ